MNKKLVKAVSLAVCAFMLLTAEGCPAEDPGKPGKAKKVAVWNDGEKSLGVQNSRKTMAAIDPSAICSWTLMYDIPHGKVVVVQTGGAKTAKAGVKMKGPGTIKYKDPKTGMMITTKNHPTSFYSENCGTWKEK